jgi:hypothetical protein
MFKPFRPEYLHKIPKMLDINNGVCSVIQRKYHLILKGLNSINILVGID